MFICSLVFIVGVVGARLVVVGAAMGEVRVRVSLGVWGLGGCEGFDLRVSARGCFLCRFESHLFVRNLFRVRFNYVIF